MLVKRKKSNFKKNIFIKKILKLIIIVFFLLVSIKIYLTFIKNLKSEEELQNLNKKLSEIIAENNQLEQQINIGLTDEFVEKKARYNLGMIAPGERVFFNITTNTKK